LEPLSVHGNLQGLRHHLGNDIINRLLPPPEGQPNQRAHPTESESALLLSVCSPFLTSLNGNWWPLTLMIGTATRPMFRRANVSLTAFGGAHLKVGNLPK
jgi:hypothetical protein